MNWGTEWSEPTRSSHTGDLYPVKTNSVGFSDYCAEKGSYKLSLFGKNSIVGKTLVIYEH